MAIDKALTFVKKASKDKDFRANCLKFDSKADLLAHFKFDEFEFEDAINMQLVKCQFEDQAVQFQHLKMWFALL